MDAKRPALPFVLTADELLSGYSAYYDGKGWVRRIGDALVANDIDAAERLNEVGLAVLKKGDLIDPYLAGVTVGEDGSIAARAYRDRYRVSGPTIEFAGPAFVPGNE